MVSEQTSHKGKNMLKSFIEFLIYVLFLMVVFFLVKEFVFQPYRVSGRSMEPTLEDSQRIIVNKLSSVDRFDIIVFRHEETDEYYIKRVIGLPGDSIQYLNDVLYIEGEPVPEPYLEPSKEHLPANTLFTESFSLSTEFDTLEVPEGTYFVMGDNRPISEDSRFFGFVPFDSIDGVAAFRYWPVEDMGLLESY